MRSLFGQGSAARCVVLATGQWRVGNVREIENAPHGRIKPPDFPPPRDAGIRFLKPMLGDRKAPAERRE